MKYRDIWDTTSIVTTVWGIFTSFPWLAPTLGSAVALLSGLITPVPIPYLLAAVSLVFACITIGLVNLDEWRHRTDPSGKLHFVTPLYGLDIQSKNDGHQIQKVQFGIKLTNNANFAIAFKMEDIRTQFMGQINPRAQLDGVSHEIPAHGDGWYRDAPRWTDRFRRTQSRGVFPSSLRTGKLER
jgi:hypothetical protein